jgi:hypothetical protein
MKFIYDEILKFEGCVYHSALITSNYHVKIRKNR